MPPHEDLRSLALHSIEKKASWSNDKGTDIFITLLNDIDGECVVCMVVGHGVSASPDQTLRERIQAAPDSQFGSALH